MKRQAMTITLNQLEMLKSDLIKQTEELNIELNIDKNFIDWGQSYMVDIINKTPECSDTWELEL